MGSVPIKWEGRVWCAVLLRGLSFLLIRTWPGCWTQKVSVDDSIGWVRHWLFGWRPVEHHSGPDQDPGRGVR